MSPTCYRIMRSLRGSTCLTAVVGSRINRTSAAIWSGMDSSDGAGRAVEHHQNLGGKLGERTRAALRRRLSLRRAVVPGIGAASRLCSSHLVTVTSAASRKVGVVIVSA